VRRAVLSAVVGAVAAAGAWAPYVARSDVSDAGFELEDIHTPLGSWTAHWGFLALATLVVVATVGGPWLRPRRRTRAAVRGARQVWTGYSACRRAASAAGAVVAAIGLILVVLGLIGLATAGHLAGGLAALALAGLCAAAGVADRFGAARARRGEQGRPPGGALAVLSLGWLYVAVIEVVSVVNDFNRMNTVFKGWFAAWGLIAAGLAASVASLLPERARRRTGTEVSTAVVPVRPRRWPGRVAVALSVAALLQVVAFVQLARPARLSDRTSPGGLSLDGLAYLDGDLQVQAPDGDFYRPADDRPIIAWLQTHVAGIVTVAEAPGQGYTWAGRISIHTGLPTVLGWPYHQSQQRRSLGSVLGEREADLQALYTSGDATVITSVLQRRQVAYLVYGTLEATLGPPDPLLAHPCLHVVFEDGPRFVARVDQTCLAEQPGALPPTRTR
jgi:uncharacterized membrane protein